LSANVVTQLLRRLGLILVGVLLACLAAEAVLRLWGGIPEVAHPLFGFHDSDPYLGWKGKPNVRLRYRRPEFDVLVQHGPEGWRMPEPPPPVHPERRVLVLGDSFTWGWGVGQGEVFTDRLQARVAPAVAVVNRGVNAFGTAQEYLLLERELAQAHYETVVLMFFLNDVVDNTDGRKGRRPYFELVDGQLVPHNQPAAPLLSPLQLFFKEHSRAYDLIDFELELLKRSWEGEAGDERGYRTAQTVDFHDLPGYAVTARLLGEMNRLAHEHGAQFVLVYIPQRSEFELDAPHPYVRAVRAMVDDITRREGIAMVDLTAPFREQTQAGAALVFPIDAHWTPAGHQVAADVLLASPVLQLHAAPPTTPDAPAAVPAS
jgi:hypothetical protein